MKWGRLRGKAGPVEADVPTASEQFQADIPVEGVVSLPPDPRMVDALAGNHRLETAIADLVDNSIDAGASRILLRFVVVDNQVKTFYVVDDGRGMSSAQIDLAMTVGGDRTYGSSDLGHFGVGLKAASFSQADSLTVLSRTAIHEAVGRRWLRSGSSQSFECDVIPSDFCDSELDRPWELVVPATGTVVRWDAIRTVPAQADSQGTSRFVTDAISRISQHLGLVFHRFLARGDIEIGIDTEETSTDTLQPLSTVGLLTLVKPVDPFGYPRTGANDYPMSLTPSVEGEFVAVTCHIWPAHSQLPQFRLPGGSREDFSGFYFYRRDRLLQAGGWNGVEVKRKELQLARVAVEVNESLVRGQVFRLNPEKSRVDTDPRFGEALVTAEAEDGRTFVKYIDSATKLLKDSNQRNRSRTPVMPLGRGIPPKLRDEIKENLPELPGHPEVQIRWKRLEGDAFFDVERDSSTIWLNTRYRPTVAGEGHASFNDAALVKTLVFLLVENLFHGSYWGPKDKDNLDLWQTLLTVAVKEDEN